MQISRLLIGILKNPATWLSVIGVWSVSCDVPFSSAQRKDNANDAGASSKAGTSTYTPDASPAGGGRGNSALPGAGGAPGGGTGSRPIDIGGTGSTPMGAAGSAGKIAGEAGAARGSVVSSDAGHPVAPPDAARRDRDAPATDGRVVEPGSALPADGLLLWLRADRGAVATSAGVSRWADQSEHHADAVQSVGLSCPALVSDGIGGKPSVLFDGVDDFLSLPPGFSDFSRGVTIFAVFEPGTQQKCSTVMELSNGRETDDISIGSYEGMGIFEVYQNHIFGDLLPIGLPQQFTAIADTGSLSTFRRNGSLLGISSGFTLPTTIVRTQNFLGKSLYDECTFFNGRVSELALYDRALPTAEVAAVEAELQSRWQCCGSP